ncbi:hypothetical protein BRADI_2g34520v3 [Brachypodium distachyon]|uniref:LOB domain-containing protein n=1 Tax=Brachypodium distachyon TaxID=15368 RepID=I1HLF5_BRADI|nr:hypothetical protein BRADI_2g34520v3 [Brachypodium distachyon]
MLHSDWQEHELGKKIKRESAAAAEADRMMAARRSSSSQLPAAAAAGAGPGSAPFNTMTPCAACKLLRRRCAQECPFSPFFSPLEPHKFASVHKVFGASNVSKMLLEVHESQRGDAANSLVYEANLRLRDPVYGCMGAILTLQQQVHALEADLAALRAQIQLHHHKQQQHTQSSLRPPPPATAGNNVPSNVLPSSHASQLLAAAAAASTAGPARAAQAAAAMGPAASASSSTTVYAAASSSTDYSSITHENVPYFG